jgi:opacity protein-like surface antigen
MDWKSVSVVFFAACLASPGAMAQTSLGAEGPYIGLSGGVQFYDGIEAGDGTDVDFDTGLGAAGQVGYRFGQLRTEVEFAYQAAEAEDVDGDVFDNTILRGTIGAYYDFSPLVVAGDFAPYVGAGVGVANIEVEGTDGNDFKDDETGLTFHAEAGFTFNVSNNFAISPNYRWEWYETNEVADVDGELYAHNIRVTGRFSF